MLVLGNSLLLLLLYCCCCYWRVSNSLTEYCCYWRRAVRCWRIDAVAAGMGDNTAGVSLLDGVWCIVVVVTDANCRPAFAIRRLRPGVFVEL